MAVDNFAGSKDMRDLTVANVHTYYEVISTRWVSVLEVREDQTGSGDIADLAWWLGDVLEYAPALRQEREPALADAPH